MKHCHEFEEMLRVKLSNKLISLLIFPLFLVTGVFFVANNIYIPFPEESIAIKESNYDILGNDKIEIASSSINSKNLYTRYCVEINSKTVTTLSFLSFNKKKNKVIFVISDNCNTKTFCGELHIYPLKTLLK